MEKPGDKNTERLSDSIIAIDGPLLPRGTAQDRSKVLLIIYEA
jgi:hypothetical protein